MIYVYPIAQRKQLLVFRGTRGSAELLGLTQRQSRSRAAANATGQWGDIVLATEWVDSAGRAAVKGDVYARQVLVGMDDSETYGTWEFVGDSRSLAGIYGRATGVGWEPNISPGGNLKTPIGTPLFDEAGAAIKRPAVGEQDRDRWTGELMFDDAGAPVLVTA